MKYLVCLVALLFLCLSPNPSFAQPNSSEVKQLKVVSDYKSEGFWAYENYWAVLGQIDELFFNGKPRQFEQKQKEALIPKYEEFVKGLIKENPKIVEELIHEIKILKELMGDYSDVGMKMKLFVEMNDRIRKLGINLQNVGKLDLRKHLLGIRKEENGKLWKELQLRISIRKEEKLYGKLRKGITAGISINDQLHDRITGINDQLHDRINKLGLPAVNNLLAKCTKCIAEAEDDQCIECIAEGIMNKCNKPLLRALAVTIPYSSLEDKVDLDSLELDEVEFMKRTRQRLFDLGWKDFEGESLDKFGFQLTKSKSPNKRTSSPESPNKSRSSSKSPERSQRTISPQ